LEFYGSQLPEVGYILIRCAVFSDISHVPLHKLNGR
jgi:hypothetical protein